MTWADTRGLAVVLDGWTGDLTVDDGGATGPQTLTVAARASAWGQAATLSAGVAWLTWRDDADAGLIVLYSSDGRPFSMDWSGNAGTRLGFQQPSYAAAAKHVAEQLPEGAWRPWPRDAFEVMPAYAHPGRGKRVVAGAVWRHLSSADWQALRLRTAVPDIEGLRSLDVMAASNPPAEVDILVGDTDIRRAYPGGWTVQVLDARDAWMRVDVRAWWTP